MFQAAAFKLLGIKGTWAFLAQIIIEMFRAQEDIVQVDGVASTGSLKLQRVLDRLRNALAKVTGLGTYWPAVKAAATRAIAANKELYTVLTDALSAARIK